MWVAIGNDNLEHIYNVEPVYCSKEGWQNPYPWMDGGCDEILPNGSIKKLIGRTLSQEDKPVELK